MAAKAYEKAAASKPAAWRIGVNENMAGKHQSNGVKKKNQLAASSFQT
jgi:hypothetical protein